MATRHPEIEVIIVGVAVVMNDSFPNKDPLTTTFDKRVEDYKASQKKFTAISRQALQTSKIT